MAPGCRRENSCGIRESRLGRHHSTSRFGLINHRKYLRISAMKIQIALLAGLSFSAVQPLYAGDDDSLTEKVIKYKVYEESDDDSTLK